jgi:hypothetical protein
MSVCVYFFDANSNQLALSPSLFGGGFFIAIGRDEGIVM